MHDMYVVLVVLLDDMFLMLIQLKSNEIQYLYIQCT